MGEEVGTMQFLEFKGEHIKKRVQRGANKKSKVRCESHVTECMTEKNDEKKKERKEERKKEEKKKKNMSMCKSKVNSPVL
jgi:hypothetical protein